ncbi:hypothetical protein [Dactylosporangium sp. CS-033363]|uniref:hypothetical protein n=1 Tax=Dactylosporangium sp. CS-033363 TaxID=3239935 RepID=UPI003D8D83E5
MELAEHTLVAAVREPEFWRCYAFDDHDGFDFEEAGEQLAWRLNDLEPADDEDDLESAQVILPVRDGWWLGLELNFEITLHELYLQSGEDDDDEDLPYLSLELGHWDQARWHPFCLRWSEVEAVVARMRTAKHPLPADVGLLLLARWVGHGSDETALLAEHRAVVAGAFERLGLFRGEEAARMAAQLMQAVPEDDYAWRWDGERGWVLEGEYAGYSNRNPGHGRFPFEEFTEFRAQLGVSS